jgi:hypothetical protein
MIYEWAISFAGLILILWAIQCMAADAMGLLGEPFGKTKSIAHWMFNLPDKILNHVFHRKPTRHFKAHV